MLNILQKNFTANEMMAGEFGIEREALRITPEGALSLEEHPKVFGDKIKNPYITTDFSESQIEMITPVFDDIKACYDFLSGLYDIVEESIGDELLWPQSMPCNIREKEIPLATYEEGEKGRAAYCYRKHLIRKYGGKKQLICGIHYNFSFKESFFTKLYGVVGNQEDYDLFKEKIYLKITRNYLRYRWLLIYLLGATTNLHESYEKECVKKLNKVGADSYTSETASSIRNGKCGYKNKKELYLDYTSVETYIASIKQYIEAGEITGAREVYSPIRLKSRDKESVLEALDQHGIQYIEIRTLDINPFDKTGIALDDLYFMHLFVLYLLVEEEDDFKTWQQEAYENEMKVAGFGQREDLMLMRLDKEVPMRKWASDILKRIEIINDTLKLNQEGVIHKMQERLMDTEQTYARRIGEKVKQEGYLNAHIELAKAYKQEAYRNRFKLIGYEDMELSTQVLMKQAIKRGIKVEVIDRKDQFIKLKKEDNIQYIKQATKTSADNYVSVLMMENKVVTKKVLAAHNISVPKGIELHGLQNIEHVLETWEKTPVVVKPKSTNFGLGISIFPEGTQKLDLEKAIHIAFRHDKDILLEEFIQGNEYRFLVIDNDVSAILRRVPANVMGDGIHTITQLVDEKNKDSLRGKGYKTPLEKIVLDEQSGLYLKGQELDFNSIPKLNEVIYLRENSNISTGGDSIDYTDAIIPYYKKIAVEAAEAMDAKICGVDMMIQDITKESGAYGIIEMNFNPAIHIHCFPYKGTERNIAEPILKLLGY
ncbi:MAG: bifunctional glutamate--cysteine ligase GshA/glutathione synthetase GshB [Cellulosilyticaceae bacterium]